MKEKSNTDKAAALLAAAAEMVGAAPGEEVPLRAICDRVGVTLPTLYHYFGSKEGLLDAVAEHGFDRYLAAKGAQEATGDPIEELRNGWDIHVRFGVENPGFYALMYGKVVPGQRPAQQERATAMLRALTAHAEREGRLVVPAGRAADHVLAANVGVTLHLITSPDPDLSLSDAVRDATLAAISGVGGAGEAQADAVPTAARRLLRALPGEATGLDEPEQTLLKKWLAHLARATPSTRKA